MEPGKGQSGKEAIQIAAGKQAEEWRGTAIRHSSAVTHSQTKLLRCGLSCLLQWSNQRFVRISGHLPHHATIVQTATILDSWSTQFLSTYWGILGWDANETFSSDIPTKSWPRRMPVASTASTRWPNTT